MRTVTFPKLHGREEWKNVYLKEDDFIIFAGNYFDSSHHTNEELVKNFLEIVEFCRSRKNVIALLGPHDLQYWNARMRIPGFREDGFYDFQKAISDNLDLFKLEHVEGGIKYTHKSIGEIKIVEGNYYIDGEEYPLVEPIKVEQRPYEEKPFEYNYIDGYKIGIYTPYMENIEQSVIDSQRAVFELFGLKINQILWKGRHAEFSNFVASDDVDFFILFDIDAIPLRPDFLEIMIKRAGKHSIVGAEQVSIHISDHAFAAPSCFIMSKDLYEKMGRPSFEITDRSDDTQELTYLAQESGINVDLIKFSHCEKEHYYWRFSDGRKYGYGSTYEDLAYHNFESRYGVFKQYFLDKCRSVLDQYGNNSSNSNITTKKI
jgi:hypothetical protein